MTMVITDNIKAEWVELGEGYNGDYNPEDPDDVELLRFDVSVLEDNQWIDPGDASYCTTMPVDASEDIKLRALRLIVKECKRAYDGGYSLKKVCEGLSHISPADFT